VCTHSFVCCSFVWNAITRYQSIWPNMCRLCISRHISVIWRTPEKAISSSYWTVNGDRKLQDPLAVSPAATSLKHDEDKFFRLTSTCSLPRIIRTIHHPCNSLNHTGNSTCIRSRELATKSLSYDTTRGRMTREKSNSCLTPDAAGEGARGSLKFPVPVSRTERRSKCLLWSPPG
jgi:hypothetical protein